jgi:hypothetical protein
VGGMSRVRSIGSICQAITPGVPFPTIWVHRRGKIREGDGVGKVNAIRGVVDAWLLVATYIQLPNLGAVSSPGTRGISPLTYRSPEVHFGKSWDQSTDIWSWGIIVCGPELPLRCSLFSRVPTARAASTRPGRFPSPGMYDSIAVLSFEEKTKAARDAMAIDFDLHSLPLCTDDAKSRAMLPPARPEMRTNGQKP